MNKIYYRKCPRCAKVRRVSNKMVESKEFGICECGTKFECRPRKIISNYSLHLSDTLKDNRSVNK